MQIGIVEPSDFSLEAIQSLKKIGDVLMYRKGKITDFLINKEIIFIRLNYFFGKDLLKNATKLKYICTPTTGLNHLDLNFLEKKNIKVISLKNESHFLSDIRATPEHTIGLILSLLRNYKKSFISEEDNFKREMYKGEELYDSKVGIIGIGRIGSILSKYLNAFDCKIYFFDIDKSIIANQNVIKCDSMDELIERCSIICLTASYQNNVIIKSGEIDKMKNKYLINTSRGELIDENYLIKKIEESHFKGVAIDVISNESKQNNNLKKFLKIKDQNLIITPHIGGATYTSMQRTEEFIVKKLKKLIQ